jgi:hypothetical protein
MPYFPSEAVIIITVGILAACTHKQCVFKVQERVFTSKHVEITVVACNHATLSVQDCSNFRLRRRQTGTNPSHSLTHHSQLTLSVHHGPLGTWGICTTVRSSGDVSRINRRCSLFSTQVRSSPFGLSYHNNLFKNRLVLLVSTSVFMIATISACTDADSLLLLIDDPCTALLVIILTVNVEFFAWHAVHSSLASPRHLSESALSLLRKQATTVAKVPGSKS